MLERRFRAMGTDCHIVVGESSHPERLLDLAVERVELLEQSWSRFRVSSSLTALNARAGQGAVTVSSDLLVLVSHMQAAWTMSDGLFDPTVITSMTALGYDTDWHTVVARDAIAVVDVTPAPGMSGIAIDAEASTVSLPPGVGIDPGAIGKGLAADVIVEELMSVGCDAVLVNLGGDIAFDGTPDGLAWAIGVEDERVSVDHGDRVLRMLEFDSGNRAGVATSTTLKRRWAQGRRHHVIDPRTGSMSTSDLVQVTVVADSAWQAEVLATTGLLLPSTAAVDFLERQGVTAILLTQDDEIVLSEEENHG